MFRVNFYIKIQSNIEEMYAYTRIYSIIIVCLCNNYHPNGHNIDTFFNLEIAKSDDELLYVLRMHGSISTKQSQCEWVSRFVSYITGLACDHAHEIPRSNLEIIYHIYETYNLIVKVKRLWILWVV